jgi:hypothetical protein
MGTKPALAWAKYQLDGFAQLGPPRVTMEMSKFVGEAKRRRSADKRASPCRTCTLCCTLPLINALEKPMYHPCRYIQDQGCSIFGKPERPSPCLAFECAYLHARRTNAPDRGLIPHPLDSGAYFHRDPVEHAYVLFVDPNRPELWKRTLIASYLRDRLMEGFTLVIFDRGRSMKVGTPFLFDEILKRDYVAFAEAEGRPLDFPSFAEEFVAT